MGQPLHRSPRINSRRATVLQCHVLPDRPPTYSTYRPPRGSHHAPLFRPPLTTRLGENKDGFYHAIPHPTRPQPRPQPRPSALIHCSRKRRRAASAALTSCHPSRGYVPAQARYSAESPRGNNEGGPTPETLTPSFRLPSRFILTLARSLSVRVGQGTGGRGRRLGTSPPSRPP